MLQELRALPGCEKRPKIWRVFIQKGKTGWGHVTNWVGSIAIFLDIRDKEARISILFQVDIHHE